MRCICATCVFLGGKSRKKWRDQVLDFKNVFTLEICFQVVFSIRIRDRSAQFLRNCFEKCLWQQTIADLIQPTCLLVSEERRKRESGKE